VALLTIDILIAVVNNANTDTNTQANFTSNNQSFSHFGVKTSFAKTNTYLFDFTY